MHHPSEPDHARHDATLIAGHAAGDLAGMDRSRADALIASCRDCAELRRDLVAIAAATRSVPAPATLRGDLRLSAEQADRLRRNSWLRAFLRPFAAASSPLRPVATAFTSLGVVGLLIGVTLSSVPGGPAAGSVDRDYAAVAPAPAATAAAAAEGGGQQEAGAPGATTRLEAAQGLGAASQRITTSSIGDEATNGFDTLSSGVEPSMAAAPSLAAVGNKADATSSGEGGEARSLAQAPLQRPGGIVIAGSLALLGIGLLLFGLRVASRRVR
jgi:hypothetical protein